AYFRRKWLQVNSLRLLAPCERQSCLRRGIWKTDTEPDDGTRVKASIADRHRSDRSDSLDIRRNFWLAGRPCSQGPVQQRDLLVRQMANTQKRSFRRRNN